MNVSAIATVLITGAVIGVLELLFPRFYQWEYHFVFVAAATLLVAVIAESSSFRPRFLMLPLWLWADVALCVALGLHGGFWFLGATALAIFTAAYGLTVYSIESDKKAWEQAPEALRRAKDAATAGHISSVWWEFQRTLYLPGNDLFPPEVCAHNLEVLSFVKQVPDLAKALPEVVETLEAGFTRGSTANKTVAFEGDTVKKMREFLRSRIDLPERTSA